MPSMEAGRSAPRRYPLQPETARLHTAAAAARMKKDRENMSAEQIPQTT